MFNNLKTWIFDWQNVEEGKTYKTALYIRSSGPLDAVVSFVTSDGTDMLAFNHIT